MAKRNPSRQDELEHECGGDGRTRESTPAREHAHYPGHRDTADHPPFPSHEPRPAKPAEKTNPDRQRRERTGEPARPSSVARNGVGTEPSQHRDAKARDPRESSRLTKEAGHGKTRVEREQAAIRPERESQIEHPRSHIEERDPMPSRPTHARTRQHERNQRDGVDDLRTPDELESKSAEVQKPH